MPSSIPSRRPTNTCLVREPAQNPANSSRRRTLRTSLLICLNTIDGLTCQFNAPVIAGDDKPPQASIWGRTIAADAVDKEVAEYRRLGLRILAVYPPTLQSEVYTEHPDWRRIPTNTTEIPQVDLKQHPYGGMLCVLGPYGDFFTKVLAEIVEKYGVEGRPEPDHW